jgi:flagellar export protein FliJ
MPQRAWTEPEHAVDALAVLARVARQALDDERHGLLRTDQAIAALCHQLAGLREAAERERHAACALADGHARLMAYLRRMPGRAAALDANLRRLEHQREAQAGRLAERHLELKRLEALVERRAERAGAERMRREQKAIDELVLVRQRRRQSETR